MAHVLTQLKLVKAETCTEAAALAQELGLELQAKRYEKSLAENIFQELTPDEVTLWAHHCPTRYFTGADTSHIRQRELKQYAFDSIPVEVMRHWKTVKDNYTFDRYEIWTTEQTRTNTDPLLIGVIGQKLYLLARWGLESPDQLPLREIAQKVVEEFIERAAGYFFFPNPRKIIGRLAYLSEWNPQLGAAQRILSAEYAKAK